MPRLSTLRRYLWCAAVLVALALYAVIAERNSWQPRQLPVRLTPPTILSDLDWQDNQKLWVQTYTEGRYGLQYWDVDSRRMLDTYPPPPFTKDLRGIARLLQDGYSRCSVDRHQTVLLKNDSTASTRFQDEVPLDVNVAKDRITGVRLDRARRELPSPMEFVVRTLSSNRVISTSRVGPPAGYTFKPKMDLSQVALARNSPVGAIGLCREDEQTVTALLIFDRNDGKRLAVCRLQPEPTNVSNLRCAPDGNAVVIMNGRKVTPNGYDMRMQSYSTRDGSLLWERKIADASFTGMELSPNSRWIASGGRMSIPIHIWDAATGQLKRRIEVTDEIRHKKFSPDSRTLACTQGNTVTLWRIE